MTLDRLTSAGLLALCVWLLISPPASIATDQATRLLIGGLCATPLLILIGAGLKPIRQWGVWVAIVLIPYFALSVGTFLVEPAKRLEGVAFATLIALVFFGGIFAARSRP
ncbi:MAG: DUF2069 domain-containing protein [Gammaproteobacteria bacterium]